MAAPDDIQPGEEIAEGQARREVERVRTIVADVYTFVRSSEINRTIGAFTFDHYIDEAKKKIKGEGWAIRDAAGEAVDVRPTKLAVLEELEKAFSESFEVIKELAKKKDSASGKDK